MPTTQNVDRLMKDFAGNVPQYAGAHLFFLDRAFCLQTARSGTHESMQPFLRTSSNGWSHLLPNLTYEAARTCF